MTTWLHLSSAIISHDELSSPNSHFFHPESITQIYPRETADIEGPLLQIDINENSLLTDGAAH
jgi:hypothetical protein